MVSPLVAAASAAELLADLFGVTVPEVGAGVVEGFSGGGPSWPGLGGGPGGNSPGGSV